MMVTDEELQRLRDIIETLPDRVVGQVDVFNDLEFLGEVVPKLVEEVGRLSTALALARKDGDEGLDGLRNTNCALAAQVCNLAARVAALKEERDEMREELESAVSYGKHRFDDLVSSRRERDRYRRALEEIVCIDEEHSSKVACEALEADR